MVVRGVVAWSARQLGKREGDFLAKAAESFTYEGKGEGKGVSRFGMSMPSNRVPQR